MRAHPRLPQGGPAAAAAPPAGGEAAIVLEVEVPPPLNLTAIRERFENPEGTMLGAPVRHAELAAPPKKPPAPNAASTQPLTKPRRAGNHDQPATIGAVYAVPIETPNRSE